MKIILLIIIINIINIKSQTFIDTVYTFTPGTGQNAGQSDIYFPNNIFGAPSINASKYVAETRPVEILSIGMGGEIIIGLKDNYIINKEGADFTIFENAFINQFNEKVYAEPAIVSVSKDGINYIEFQYNIETLEGLAGTIPTYGKKNPFNPKESGGNSFDLSEINIDTVKYIKIKDITEQILNNSEHNNYDPTLSGFDLDAVAIINYTQEISSVKNKIVEIKEIIYFDILGNKINNINNYYGLFIKKEENEFKKYIR